MHIRSPPRSFLKNKIKLKYKIKNNNSGRSLPSLLPSPDPTTLEREAAQGPPWHPPLAPVGSARGCRGGGLRRPMLLPNPPAGPAAGGGGSGRGSPSPPHTFGSLHTLSITLTHPHPLFFPPRCFSSFFVFFFLMEKKYEPFLFVCLFVSPMRLLRHLNVSRSFLTKIRI